MVDEKPADENRLAGKTRQEQRERRRKKEKAKMSQHGKGLVKVYRDATLKRARDAGAGRKSG